MPAPLNRPATADEVDEVVQRPEVLRHERQDPGRRKASSHSIPASHQGKASKTIILSYAFTMIDAAGLRVMKAIADEEGFTGAANALGFSQPAISQMVRRLEQRTGTVLVERYGRQVRLTEAGQVLARHAVGVLAALDAAEEEITAIAGLRAGQVRLQAFPARPRRSSPRRSPSSSSATPDITVTFTEAEPPESLAALRNGDCDVAVAFAYEGADLGELEEDLSLLETQHLLDDEVRVVVRKRHPLGPRECLDVRLRRRGVDRRMSALSRPPRLPRAPRGIPARGLRDRGPRRPDRPHHRRPRGRPRARPHPQRRQARARRDPLATAPLAAPDPRRDDVRPAASRPSRPRFARSARPQAPVDALDPALARPTAAGETAAYSAVAADDARISFLPIPTADDVPEGVGKAWAKAEEAFGFVPNVFKAQAVNGDQFLAWWNYFNLS